MNPYRIAVIVGSLRRESYNRQLAAAVQRLAPSEFEFADLAIGDLPLYNQDQDADPPAAAVRLKSDIASAQGLLFVTPEYNRSISGVLKNAIDHASRPYGKNAWGGKPAGMMGMSVGAMGTSLAQQHLRNILACLDVPVLGLPEVFLQVKEGLFDSDGNIANAETKKLLQGWMDRYAAWIKTLAAR